MSGPQRRNAVLIAVVAVLAAFLFLWEQPRDARRQARRAAAARLFPVDAAAIDTVRLRHVDGVTIVARSKGAWQLLAPVRERAEEETVDHLLTALTEAEAEETVIAESDSTVWPNFTVDGATPGSVRVELATAAGARTVVWVGGDNPDLTGVYVRREGSRAIELASPSLANLARITYQGLRRYQLFEVARDSVAWLDVASPAGRWTARRTPRGLWFTEEAPPRQLKRYEIELLVHDLASQRIQAYVEDGVSDERFAAYGLHQPVLDLAFTAHGDPLGRRRLQVGNEAENQAWFARRDSQRSVLRITGPLLATASRPLGPLLETNPIPDNYALLDSMNVRWLGGGDCTLVRAGRDFKMRLPVGWQGDAGRLETPVRNLVRGLEELASDGTTALDGQRTPESVAPEQRIACRLFWPDRAVRFTLGWRSGEPYHWLHVEGERVLHRVDRELYFRLYSVLLAAGQIPGEQPLDSAAPADGG